MARIDEATKEQRKERLRVTLQRQRGLTEAELAGMLQLERRTVNNYLRELEMEGKVYKEGTLWLAFNYQETRLHPFELTPEEAMTLYLGARLLVKQHDRRNEPAESALLKLAEVLKSDAGIGEEIYQTALELARRPVDEGYQPIFRTLMRGYVYRKRVEMVYQPLHGNPFPTRFATYLVEPSPVGYTTYLIGYSSAPNALRAYKLERVQSARLTDEDYHIPEDFPGLDILRHAWSIVMGDELVEVALRFNPRARQRVLETRWHPSQETWDDPDRPGYLLWKVQVADTLDMLPWIRGWGADVEVVGPEELRETLKLEAKRLVRRYGIATRLQDMEFDRLLRCWGKTRPGSNIPDEFHPALFHMLDVGYVAKVLLSDRASPRWRNVLANALGADRNVLSDWLPWIVAMHDIGKISAAFQEQNELQFSRLKVEGFNLGERRWGNEPHHGFIGQVFLAQELDTPLPDSLRRVWREVVGGHHGQFAPSGSLATARARLKAEPQEWVSLRKKAANTLQGHLLDRFPDNWPEPANISAAIMALTGFTTLCDWLGSNETWFPINPDVSMEEYLGSCAEKARVAAESAGFFQPSKSSASQDFLALFPDLFPPRSLQTTIDAIPADVLSSPCLAVIEAPTGEGKTEAALALAHRLSQASGSDELYYALPTVATSNQMFERLLKYLHINLGLETRVKLIHGQAFLYEDDLSLKPLGNGESFQTKAALEWFGPKKRALLAPFGVGTIDQAELAALNVRYTALRLIGLAGKVVIVDEVHAYDTYMTTIVERLLNWLSALGSSVILLSATLPKARRAALLRAYGIDQDFDSKDEDLYPSLWVVSQSGSYHATPQAYQPNRQVYLNTKDLHFSEDEAEGKARWLLEAVENGGCACWLTNTVARAQKIFEAVDRLASPEVDRLLLHAQFPLDDRRALENQIVNKFGPGESDRPKRGIVIGTQVLEQSLDLDFDIMVTDLAPIDLLLQRAGRLHRHARPRPNAHAIPRFWINTELEAGILSLSVDRNIYSEYILRQTWLTLNNCSMFNLPADYHRLVEAVYGAADSTPNELLAAAWKNLQKQESEAVTKAYARLLPEPDPDDPFCGPAALLVFEENENDANWVVARTRLGEETLTLIPMERKGDTAWLYIHDKKVEVSLKSAAPRHVQLQLLRRSLRVSNRSVIQALKNESRNQSLPRLFTESALLKECLPLWMSNGRAILTIGNTTIHMILDPKLGLIIRKEKGE